MRFFILIISFIFLNFAYAINSSAVTYTFSGARFGDNLIAYLHAKWIAYHYNIPLLYKPFEYSSNLVLDDEELKLTQHIRNYRNHVWIGKGEIIIKNPKIPILYVSPYFPEDVYELANSFDANNLRWPYFKVDWDDVMFKKLAKELISPKQTLCLITPPQERVNIAIHVREGGGFDPLSTAKAWPEKFPPTAFYVQSLIKLLTIFKDVPLYCYIFTDALNPESLALNISASMPEDLDIIFDYRKSHNNPYSNVIEDFFSFFNFDAIVRPQSNFSMVPTLISDYAAVCFPNEFFVKNGVADISQIELKFNEEIYHKVLNRVH